MIDSIKKLIGLLTPAEQKKALLLCALMLISGLVEVAGIASVFPLIAVLSDPDSALRNMYLSAVYTALDFSDVHGFLIFLSAGVFAMIALRATLTSLASYALLRFSHMRAHSLSVRLLATYFSRPYGWFLNRHSADMGKAVLSEVEQVVAGSLMPALNLISQAIVALCVILLLFVVNPWIAATVTIAVGGAYAAFYFGLRSFLARKGQLRFRDNRQRFQIAHEALSGIKEVKIAGLERAYLQRFELVSQQLARHRSILTVVKEVPRSLLEVAAVGGLLAIVILFLSRDKTALGSILPLLAVYAFAGYRLLPALQNVYKNLVALKFGGPAVDALHRDLVESRTPAAKAEPPAPMPLVANIKLDNVSFKFPNAKRAALSSITFDIKARSTIGIVGRTGAGKSTLVDVILGLLEPQTGSIFVDGKRITAANVRSWQRSIGYVPQHIFLADESISANIAFGVDPDKVDMAAVERAANIAELHDFVVQELPDQYQTVIGERGVRLSGGQRQRIGIARALYRDPELLVLDEATSALDHPTERAVIEAVRKLTNKKTIIMIAHRLTTLQECSNVVVIDEGRIRASGSFEDLLAEDEGFRNLAGAA